MRSRLPQKLEEGRIIEGKWGSDARAGPNGMFTVAGPTGRTLRIIASDGEGWQHVSVSVENRPPNWSEMNMVKDLFWDEEETVVQFHPPRSQYVNHHPYTLHMWRKDGFEYPLPPTELVGPK